MYKDILGGERIELGTPLNTAMAADMFDWSRLNILERLFLKMKIPRTINKTCGHVRFNTNNLVGFVTLSCHLIGTQHISIECRWIKKKTTVIFTEQPVITFCRIYIYMYYICFFF